MFQKSNTKATLISFSILAATLIPALWLCNPGQSLAQTASEASLKVIGRVPLEGDTLGEQIIFFFNEEIELPASEGAIAPPPMRINPPIDGEITVGSNYISFKLNPNNPGQRAHLQEEKIYEVELNGALRSKSGKPLSPEQRVFHFASHRFEPQRIWVLDEKENRLVIGLNFTYAADLDSLKERISVRTQDDRSIRYSFEQGTNEKTYHLTLEDISDEPVKITVVKGVKSKDGQFTSEQDVTFVYPSERELTVKKTNWQPSFQDVQEIRIDFSDSVVAEELQKCLIVTDLTDGTILDAKVLTTGLEKRHKISVSVPNPDNVRFSLAITQGLTGSKDAVLKTSYSMKVEYQTAPLQLYRAWWEQEGRDGIILYVETNKNLRETCTQDELQDYIEVSPHIENLQVEFHPYWSRSFRVKGDFSEKQAYQLTVKPGLKIGKRLQLAQPVSIPSTSGEVSPYLGFGLAGQYYFPRRSGLLLPIESRKLSEININLYRMFPSNLVVALDDMLKGQGGDYFNSKWCEKVAQQTTNVSNSTQLLAQSKIPLDELFPEHRRGIFCLQASGKDSNQDTKLVIYTDIGLLAHWQDNEVIVFAHDLFSLAPLETAKVTVYSYKNQVLGEAHTNAQGIAHLRDLPTRRGTPVVIVVESGEDFTFLELEARPDGQNEIKGDMPGYDRNAYDAFVYADRELYRPGETVHLRWIVRTNYGDALANVPLLATVIKPNGKQLFSEPTELSAYGTGGRDIETQDSYPTGKYTVQISLPGTKRVIGSMAFSLEDFVPHRMKAKVELSENKWLTGKQYRISVNAMHLFGAPAVDRKCDAKILFKRGGFEFENWKEYRFDNDSDSVPKTVQLGEGKTDSEGNAHFDFTYTPEEEITAPLQATVIGEVYELGGRAVSGKATAFLSPSEIHLGLLTASNASNGLDVHVAAVNHDGMPAELARVKVTLEKQVWNYYVRRYYSDHQPNWSQSFESIETKEVDLQDGKGVTSFNVKGYGYYRVRVHSEATPQYSTQSFYCYGDFCEIADSARPSLIKLILDKPEYEAGDTAELRIESPFDGKGIVVLEQEDIREMIPIELKNQSATVKIPLTQENYPNVWIEVTVIHEVNLERAQVYPFSSFAAANLQVHNPARKIDVQLANLPEVLKPDTDTAFAITTKDLDGNPVSAEVTLAAIDEGIHSITNYQNPDPYAWIARTRRPDMHRAHYYDHVVYDFEKSEPGGGAEGELAKRVAGPDLENWIKPVALWSQVIQTNESGQATVEMKIPEFTGQLRLVVVACNAKASGAQNGNVFVRRDHMLRTSMPRFLLLGDEMECRAVAFNHGGEACTAQIQWAGSGTIEATDGESTLELPVNGEASTVAKFTAGQNIGQAKIQWTATFTGSSGEELDTLKEVAPIPVYPPAAFQSSHRLIILEPGQEIELRNDSFMDDERTELHLSAGGHPALMLQDALQYVVRYPYGCAEQTTSQLMPLYLLRKDRFLVDSVLDPNIQLDHYIQSGIDRLFSMQTASGGLGFWPGDMEPWAYGSVYALHFLTFVKNGREYEIPDNSYESLKSYVRGVTQDWSNQSESSLYLRAYGLYVLALGGDLEALQQIGRFDSIRIPTAARFLLAAALARSTQDSDRVKMYLSETPSRPFEVTEPDETLNSDIRNTAVELLALLQMDGDKSEMAKKADRLVAFLQEHNHGTTQETSLIMTALTDYLTALASNIDSAAFEIKDERGSRVLTGNDIYTGTYLGPNGSFAVRNTGGTNLYVNFTIKGIPTEVNAEPVSEGIALTRTIYNSKGKEHAGNTLQQGENYIIGLQINCERIVKNLVVADLLPAGLEIENPRLDPDAIPEGAFAGAVTPSHLEIRDDRLVLAFKELASGAHNFYYIVRAITPGSFQHPAVEAECMYLPSVHGSSAPSKVVIR